MRIGDGSRDRQAQAGARLPAVFGGLAAKEPLEDLGPLLRREARAGVPYLEIDQAWAGERWGGAISAALFLKEFTGDTPWMHLDIAGPSNSNKEKGYFAKGATGFGVRTLVELIRKRAAELETIETAEDSDVTA